ncbi:MAG: hypothetical protein L6M37_01765 [Candidatus Methylarchaceae archaeon HK02M1]|nr:hypothetical protein [Candidatus Methylarchaceae archaeon HK01M]MCP8311663.1 hypothetical protein [Candidatus Methylarchaceae archaeon HK02M1]
MNKRDMELLKFNYTNLNESIWNNHKIAWTVTSIFIPVIFGLQGYLFIQYYIFSKSQVLGIFITGIFLMSIWLLTMRIFEHYNDVRRERLKKIEDIFNRELSNEIRDFFKDEKGDGKGFKHYHLPFKDIPKQFKFSPMKIYHMIFWTYILLNVILLGAKFLSV